MSCQCPHVKFVDSSTRCSNAHSSTWCSNVSLLRLRTLALLCQNPDCAKAGRTPACIISSPDNHRLQDCYIVIARTTRRQEACYGEVVLPAMGSLSVTGLAGTGAPAGSLLQRGPLCKRSKTLISLV